MGGMETKAEFSDLELWPSLLLNHLDRNTPPCCLELCVLFLHGVSTEIADLPSVIASDFLKERDWKFIAAD